MRFEVYHPDGSFAYAVDYFDTLSEAIQAFHYETVTASGCTVYLTLMAGV